MTRYKIQLLKYFGCWCWELAQQELENANYPSDFNSPSSSLPTSALAQLLLKQKCLKMLKDDINAALGSSMVEHSAVDEFTY